MILERLRWLTWGCVLLFVIVDMRLVHLQFVAREFWESEAIQTREDGESVPFRRGSIVDRYGKQLAVGEIEQTLNLHYSGFRRNTPLGQLHAGLRMLRDEMGHADVVVPRLDEMVQQATQYARLYLGMTERELTELPRRVRDDYGYYARTLLGMTADEYRSARAQFPDDKPLSELSEDTVERVVAQVTLHAKALGDLAKAIGIPRSELLLTIDEKIREIEQMIADAEAASSVPVDAKQRLAYRRDYENRVQTLARGIPYKAVFLVNMAPERFLGLEIHDIDSRRYPSKYENLAPTLIGWVGAATVEVCKATRQHELRLRQLESQPPERIDDQMADEIYELRERLRRTDYLPEEQMGREGLESVLEPVLRGERGYKKLERDRMGVDIEAMGKQPPIDGRDVQLTLDADLQLAAERVLDKLGMEASIVLLDPTDGAIRAMATWPNPSREDVTKNYGKLVNDPREPLFHRAFRLPGNPPPPGSVFKLIVAAAGLESGALSEYTPEECTEKFPIYGITLKCLHHHGLIDLKTALQKSCNIYFYKTARAVGLERIVDMATRIGIGTKYGFADPEALGLVGEGHAIDEQASKLVPWDKKRSSKELYTMHTAIGHGAVDDITPLQVATMVAPFANGGDRVTPYIVSRIGEKEWPHAKPESIGLKSSTVDIIRHAMIMVCEPGGTAGPGQNGVEDLRPWRVAGKTGTPQSIDKGVEVDHAWFAGFFPYDKPQLAFAVYVAGRVTAGGQALRGGGRTCRPLLYDLLQQPELRNYVVP